MREVIRQYGGAMLAVTAAIAILMLLFVQIGGGDGVTGVWHIIGARAQQSTGEMEQSISQEMEELYNRSGPKCQVRQESLWYAKVSYALEELVAATDQEGNPAEIFIEQAVNPAGEDILSQVQDNQGLTFPQKGVYRLLVRGRDTQGRVSRSWVYINMNQRLSRE